MAAAVLGRPAFSVDDLVAELAWPADTAVGLVETAGGPRSPIAADGDSVDLCTALSPDIVCWWPTPGWGRSTPSGCRWRSCSPAARR